jgi:hypothetical protein
MKPHTTLIILMTLCVLATQGCSSTSRATSTQSLPAEEVDEKIAPIKQDEVVDTQQIAQADDGFDGSAEAYHRRAISTHRQSQDRSTDSSEHLSIISDLTKAADLFHEQEDTREYGIRRLIDSLNELRTNWVEEYNRNNADNKISE